MPHRAAVALGLLLVVLTSTGCTTLHDQIAGDGGVADDGAGAGSGAGPGSGSTPLAGSDAAQIDTVTWAVADRTLSVVVRNDSRRVLRRADAVVRAVDAEGITLATSATMPGQDVCCTASSVAPGASYGFYVDVGDRGDQVADVEIDYADVVWSPADPAVTAPAVTTTGVGLDSDDTGAVALVELVAAGSDAAGGSDVVPEVTVQARLEDAAGRLVAVVSGRWTCVQPGQPREARLQLFHPVPEGTVLGEVAAFPVDDPDPPRC